MTWDQTYGIHKLFNYSWRAPCPAALYLSMFLSVWSISRMFNWRNNNHFLNLGAEMIRHIMNYSVDRELICQIFDNIKSVTLVSTLNGDVEVRWHTLEFTSASEELFSPAIKLSNENKNRIVWWSLVYVSLNKISLRFLGRWSDNTSTLRPAPPGILILWHSDFIFAPLIKLRQTFQ